MLEQPAFGKRLRALRLQRGLSQSALAAGGLSTGYLSRLESGARPPTSRAIEHLAQRLGVAVSAFGDSPADTEGPTSHASAFARMLAEVVSAANDTSLAEPLAQALREETDYGVAPRWQALWLLAKMRGSEGRHEEQYELLTELVKLSDTFDSAELPARAYTGLARCARTLGRTPEALKYAVRAMELSTGLSPATRAAALQALIPVEAEVGELPAARRHADQLCELTKTLPGTAYVEALWSAATVRIRQSDFTEAQELLERALDQLDSQADLVLWMRLRLAAASLYLQITPPLIQQMQARLREVAPVVELVGTDLHRQELFTLRALLAMEEGRIDDAWKLSEIVAGETALLSFRDRTKFEALRGRLLILRGEREAGIQRLQELAQQAQEARSIELAAEIWRSLAETLAEA